jgi:hypothetical protein
VKIMSHSERPAATRRPMQQQHSGGGSPPLGEVFSMDEDHSSVSGKEKDLDRQSEQLRAVALFDDREVGKSRGVSMIRRSDLRFHVATA